ncbi:DUF3800 domain-containing protein [Escherichia coli]|uniref:DUF3800 domain-containing protein n=2 Tax=Escherichia coli TaxID=562 RepID=UPI000F93731A|nr:DUF3800 domain-containing protein [Escherichia coli]EBB8914849.1 DUF3800 domain-containing protein [Salmonella enterica]EBC3901982.1 DUF3800 domain-containing protein [Salmonella enterica subsp. enterica serovar Ohio]EDL9773138.1 DUF3800 domain-containing protein [Salmonella enterica subsp. enterica serovar Heidelberg]EBE7511300.1 DUF3800 domain-containing protein [Salmonella enterica]EBE8392999.1 DUF3800 domain-containing protein [Salmonella enterica]
MLNRRTFNVFCDESCHLLNDHNKVMVLGALWCPGSITKKIARDIKELKLKHNLKPDFEIKWTKVSASKVEFYLDVVDYFFSNPALRFRGVVVPDKEQLDHARFHQDHNTFYYKMFFYVLKNIIESDNTYNIYLDIKDTLGIEKIEKLRGVLHNDRYDYNHESINRIQHIRSHEVQQLQLTDLFIGALGYVHRGMNSNAGKIQVINRIKSHTNRELLKSTLPTESKFNIFVWEAR